MEEVNQSSDLPIEISEKDLSSEINDPGYAYTQRDEFTSENFKIILRGLPRYFPVGQIKKMLNETLNLSAHKVKPHGPGRSWAYVNFRSEEAKNEALKVLDEYKWKNCTLNATSAKPAKDPLVSYQENSRERKSPETTGESITVEERIAKAVTPHAGIPYEEQLKLKEQKARYVFKHFGSQLSRVNEDLKEFVTFHQKRRAGQVCEFKAIKPSPVTDNYRNKCEFTIGMNPQTKKPTVGFRLTSYRGGSVSVGSIAHLKHVSESMKKVVQLFEEYIRKSAYQPFDPVTHEGVWRQLTCRTTCNNDLLIIIVIHPQDLDTNEQTILRTSLVEFFTVGEGKQANVSSIFFHQYNQRQRGSVNMYDHLWGKEYITETILGRDFRVSPDAFLQVNTPACEVLYRTIAELADVNQDTVLLDICCGTGTIGISLAQDCKKVVGVDIVSQAIEDARENAERNGVENITLFDGKAETHINNMMQGHEEQSCVAVVDPPRAGLHNSVVCALRRAENLNRFIYVSCDPKAATQNFLAFGRACSKTYKGTPFIPVKVIPIDLFPHTPHFELVVLFERYDEEKWARIFAGNPRPTDKEYYENIPKLPAPNHAESGNKQGEKRKTEDANSQPVKVICPVSTEQTSTANVP